MPTINEVKSFWNANPLLTGELEQETGSKEWFEAFDNIKNINMREDKLPLWIGDDLIRGKRMLDVGCGPGYWCRAARSSNTDYHGIDISDASVALALRSAELFGASCNITVGNAEEIDYPDNHFDHVLSEGVVHHTPDTAKALNEIVRVMKVGGTATISVYYKNILIRNEFLFNACRKLMKIFNLTIKGRKRDKMQSAQSADDFVRMYDGADNPIGKAYTYNEFQTMLPSNCTIKGYYLYFSPLRAFFRNRFVSLNKILDVCFGLMICFQLEKRQP